MLKKRVLALCFAFLGTAMPAHAGFIYQGFEPESGVPINIYTLGNSQVATADRTEAVHFGRYSVKFTSSYFWSGVGVYPQYAGGSVDLKQENNDRLIFWTFAMPRINCYVYGCDKGTDNNVGLVFFDTGKYASTGFEVWTTQSAHYQQWTKLNILFSQLPPDFDLRHVSRIEFKEYNPGKYFFDDIHAVREDRIYQNFEIQDRVGSTQADYGWKWNAADTVGISTVNPNALHHQGSYAWMVTNVGNWGGTGIQSQSQKYLNTNGAVSQTFWSVDLMPENNDRLTFWFYNQSDNAMDNNMGVQFYDNGTHANDNTKVVVWPKKGAAYGKWTHMTVLFSDILKQAPDFNLKDINKIQFQNYWTGTVYIDDIRATGPQPVIKESSLAQGIVQWDPVAGAANYRVQESLDGPDGSWHTIYSGPGTSFNMTRLSKAWLRIRWEEPFTDKNTIPYWSDWSDPALYLPPFVALSFKSLQAGQLIWNTIPQATSYIVQYGPSKFGPWTQLYKGTLPTTPLTANAGTWYRVQAVRESSGVVTDVGSWSRPQSYVTGQGFVKAAGKVIKDANGAGDTLVLNGVNLGGVFLIEPWMNGVGPGDSPALTDDWTIRSLLNTRFGATTANTLLKTYQEAYTNGYDLNLLLDQGVTLARLPFYYRMLQDDNGNWILNSSGQIDFSPLDRLVDGLADRGIYVVLDLHGVPGYQSADPNTGRGGQNALWVANDVYRARTVTLWTEIARHYKDNPWVLGYDLLNEPVGVGSNKTALADLYHRLYQAIRTVDPNHLIIMEGVWYADPTDPQPDPNKKRQIVDWDTLPVPSTKGWTNVMYQFHFYHWTYTDANGNVVNADEHYPSHKAFIDQKVLDAHAKEPTYNVPVMIGEFYGFGLKSVWDYYVSNFNAEQWSWTSWTYKYHNSPANWGFVVHDKYNESEVNIRQDYLVDLTRKFSKFSTADYHSPNDGVQGVISASAKAMKAAPSFLPFISTESPTFLQPGQNFRITGKNFGPSTETHSLKYGGVTVPLISWSDTEIQAYIPGSPAPAPSGTLNVVNPRGTSNGVDIIIQSQSPAVPPLSPPPAPPILPGMFSFSTSALQTPGTVQFYPAPCSDIPPGTHPCNNADAAITLWSDYYIQGWVPPDALMVGERMNIRGVDGGDLYPTMLRPNNHAPVLNAVSNRTVNVGATLSIVLSATDSDGDALGYAVYPFPQGATMSGNTFTWVPLYNQAGTYTLTFQASDGQFVSRKTAVVTVVWNAPDLIVTSLTPGAGTVGPAGTLPVSTIIANQSTKAASSSSVVGYHLSTDAVYGGTDDIPLSGSPAIAGIALSSSLTSTPTLTAPITVPGGQFYLCASADDNNTVIESIETNNGFCSATKIQVVLPDLLMTSLTGPAAGTIGGNITFTDTVNNQGFKSASFYVDFYLSTDATITTADRRLGSRLISTLDSNVSDTATTTLAIPTNMVPGTYYLGAIVDSTGLRAETSEANNAFAGSTVVLSPGADFTVNSVSAPALAYTGGSVVVSDTVSNAGTTQSVSFTMRYYLSVDSVITATDLLLGSRAVPALMPGALNSAATTFNVPANWAPGTYYIGAIADQTNAVAETNESNNALAGNTLAVSAGFDYKVTAVSGPASGTRGAAINITHTVQNAGPGNSADFYVGLYLSTDSTITTADRFLGNKLTTGPVAGVSVTATTSVTLPATLTPGVYYVGAIADYNGARTESNEANNSLAGNTINVI